MRKNEITLQEMFSTIVEELRESGRWGTAHIYQASSNAFSAFTNYQALPLRKLSPTVLKTLRKPPATKELQLEYGIYLH